jgi:hypothetical protein
MSLLFTLNLASRFRSRPKFLPVFQDDREISAVQQGLKEAGYIEGRNVAIKYRPAGGRFDRLPGLAAELVADPVAVMPRTNVVAPLPLPAVASNDVHRLARASTFERELTGANVGQAPMKRGQHLPGVTGRFPFQESNHRHLCLLRARRERPRRHAAE